MDENPLRAAPLAFAALVVSTADVASAHPIHEVVQNAYLTLSPGSVSLQLELTAGPKVAGRIIAALDTDHDRQISPSEGRNYALRVLSASRLLVDGKPLALRLISIDVPAYPALLGAYGTITIKAVAVRPDRFGTATLSYRNGYSPSESRCDANIFLKSERGSRYSITSQERGRDGRDLKVRFTTSTI